MDIQPSYSCNPLGYATHGMRASSYLRWTFSVLEAFVSILQVDCGALQRQVGERQAKEAFDAQRDRCNCLAALASNLLQNSL